MSKKIKMYVLTIFFGLSCGHTFADKPQPTQASNFTIHSIESKNVGKPLVLYFSAKWCEFCKILNEEVINPVILGGGLENGILLTLQIDDAKEIIDFNGEHVTPDAFALNYDVDITPTIIYVGPNGKEIAPRIIGITNIDFYFHYLTKNADIGKENMRNN